MMTGQALIKTVSDTIETPEELTNDDSSAAADSLNEDSSNNSASEDTETTPEEESSPDDGGGRGGKGRRRLRLITNYEDKLVNTQDLIDSDILPGAWTTMVEWMSSYDSNGYNDLL